MDEFFGGFFGSITGMFLIGVVLTMAQALQHAKQSKKYNDAERENASISRSSSRIGEA